MRKKKTYNHIKGQAKVSAGKLVSDLEMGIGEQRAELQTLLLLACLEDPLNLNKDRLRFHKSDTKTSKPADQKK